MRRYTQYRKDNYRGSYQQNLWKRHLALLIIGAIVVILMLVF
jgi:hypothetical protein